MNRRRLWAAAITTAAALLAAGACQEKRTDGWTGATPGKTRAPVATADFKLELTGSGLSNPCAFTYEQLCEMEMETVKDVLMDKTHEPDERGDWRGPPLAALLATARPAPGPRDLTLMATDGYTRHCRLADLDGAIVALQDGQGRWLIDLDKSCALRLVPPKLTGDYWVRNLSRITVEPRTTR